ncbi:hypothetical protein [Selenomonas sp. AB3002]|uniref:hypothetical protein n=1 Tax=Selenomonas sp. AB3002 TaxID=1392502 RepID=UPI000B089CCE
MNKFAFIIAAICSAISFPYHTAAAEAIGLTLTDSIEMALLTDESIEGAEAGREAACMPGRLPQEQRAHRQLERPGPAHRGAGL